MSEAPSELRALVVDDEEDLARLVADYLHQDGFTTQVALDGKQALELARAASPDVVVLDLMLPGMDGVEVCRRLRTFTDAYVIFDPPPWPPQQPDPANYPRPGKGVHEGWVPQIGRFLGEIRPLVRLMTVPADGRSWSTTELVSSTSTSAPSIDS